MSLSYSYLLDVGACGTTVPLLHDDILVLKDGGDLSLATAHKLSYGTAGLARLTQVDHFNLLLEVEMLPLASHTELTH